MRAKTAVDAQPRRADRVSMTGSLQQSLVFMLGDRLGAIGHHDQMLIGRPVNATKPWVVQDSLVVEVEQALLVDRTGQDVE